MRHSSLKLVILYPNEIEFTLLYEQEFIALYFLIAASK